MSLAVYKEDKVRGDVGENMLLKVFPTLKKGSFAARKEYDFFDGVTGATYELKTDFYQMSQTKNFFIEKYSSIENSTLGGPFRSTNTTYYAYFYIKDNLLFLFKTDILLKVLESVCANLELVPVPNMGYTTGGYKVPRSLIAKYAEIIIRVV